MTGFQLKYPDSAYGQLMSSLGFTEHVRQWVHRISAVVMLTLSFYHAVYLVFTSRGRDVLRGLFPKFRDITQAVSTLMYYGHLTKKHPSYDNYNYMEKLEYWALIWGTLVMGATGIVLWFPTIVGNWAPVWFIKVSEIVHFYEAILATLAIVIWHWFFVIFHPKEYPVSFTVIDGKMSVAHYKGEHRLQYNKVILEYLEVKDGKRSLKSCSYFTRSFIKAIESNGLTMEMFLQEELENDGELRMFVENQRRG
jgi:cytochrome b subunit of formate dehydrogenase